MPSAVNTPKYVAHSETSREAAIAALPQAKAIRLKILAALDTPDARRCGLTKTELEEMLSTTHQTVSSVLSRLEEDAEICRNGTTRAGQFPKAERNFAYYLPDAVPVEQRLPVIRRREVVVDWYAVEEARLDALVAAFDRAMFAEDPGNL